MLFVCCKGETMTVERIQFDSFTGVSPSTWEALANRKIFFGHQSVGDNIIQGIGECMDGNPGLKLDVRKTKKTDAFGKGVFAHFPIGKNEDPGSKIDDFNRIMRSGIGERVDIALFKFCFVDITASTDVRKLFDEYRATMASLRGDYPDVTFVNVTVPLLRKEKSSLKAWMKKVLGRGDGFFADEHNVRRNEFNELIRKEYGGRAPVFDLAAIESAYPDGSRETFTHGGKIYYSLAPDYTEDGGHLNGPGRKVVSEQFLVFLSRIP